ncbi:MAG: putative metallopeptidase [Candidatus Micrarchaeia archaeon]
MGFKISPAPDVEEMAKSIVTVLPEFSHINNSRVFYVRSTGSKARAYARIWELPSIWQNVLSIGPYYIIEVLSQNFDKLPAEEKTKVIIHELLHIPKTFSGSIKPHRCFKDRIDRKIVNRLYEKYVALLSQ